MFTPAAAPVRSAMGERLDRLPTAQIHLFILLVLGFGQLFDSVEGAMSNVLATVFASRPGVTPSELGMLLTSLFIGGAIGAPLAGALADRIGRRATLLLALLGYSVTSMAAGFADDIVELSLARFAGGFFLASYPPLMWTYLTDVLPPNNRGRMMMIAGAVGSLGGFLAPFGSRQLDVGLGPFEGWQWTLILGGFGGLIVAFACTRLPESPRWLERRGLTEAASAAAGRFEASRPIGPPPPPALPAEVDTELGEPAPAGTHSSHKGRLALVASLQFLQQQAIIGFAALSGVVLSQKGFDVHSSLLYVAVAALGAPAGALIASTVVDRFARHKLFIACALIMAALGVCFALVNNPAALMIIGAAYMVGMVIYSMTLNIYAPEMFVTERRGFASGVGQSANRLGAAAVPLVLLPLLMSAGGTVLFLLIAATLVVSAALVFLFGPRNTAGHAIT